MFPCIPCHVILLRKDGRSIIDRIRLSRYFLRIWRSGVNINSTFHFLSLKINKKIKKQKYSPWLNKEILKDLEHPNGLEVWMSLDVETGTLPTW